MMKIRYFILVIWFIFGTLLPLTSCGGDDPEEEKVTGTTVSKKDIIGVWKVISKGADDGSSIPPIGNNWLFYDNGEFVSEGNSDYHPEGTWFLSTNPKGTIVILETPFVINIKSSKMQLRSSNPVKGRFIEIKLEKISNIPD